MNGFAKLEPFNGNSEYGMWTYIDNISMYNMSDVLTFVTYELVFK